MSHMQKTGHYSLIRKATKPEADRQVAVSSGSYGTAPPTSSSGSHFHWSAVTGSRARFINTHQSGVASFPIASTSISSSGRCTLPPSTQVAVAGCSTAGSTYAPFTLTHKVYRAPTSKQTYSPAVTHSKYKLRRRSRSASRSDDVDKTRLFTTGRSVSCQSAKPSAATVQQAVMHKFGHFKLVRHGSQVPKTSAVQQAKKKVKRVPRQQQLKWTKKAVSSPANKQLKWTKADGGVVPAQPPPPRKQRNRALVNSFKLVRNRTSRRSSTSGRAVQFAVSADGLTLRRLSQHGAASSSVVRLMGAKFVDERGGRYKLDQRAQLAKKRASCLLNSSVRLAAAAKGRPTAASVDRRPCLAFNRFGRCARAATCRLVHDPASVAVCTRFARGTCDVASCAFSHAVSPRKMPACAFFLRGVCARTDCPYLHVKHADSAPVCRLFLKGLCQRAANVRAANYQNVLRKLGRLQCDKKHVFPKSCWKRRSLVGDRKAPKQVRIASKLSARPAKSLRKSKSESDLKSRNTGGAPAFLPDFIPLQTSDSEDDAADVPNTAASPSR